MIWYLGQRRSGLCASLQTVKHSRLTGLVRSGESRPVDIHYLVECNHALGSVVFRPVHNLKQIQLPNNVEKSSRLRE